VGCRCLRRPRRFGHGAVQGRLARLGSLGPTYRIQIRVRGRSYRGMPEKAGRISGVPLRRQRTLQVDPKSVSATLDCRGDTWLGYRHLCGPPVVADQLLEESGQLIHARPRVVSDQRGGLQMKGIAALVIAMAMGVSGGALAQQGGTHSSTAPAQPTNPNAPHTGQDVMHSPGAIMGPGSTRNSDGSVGPGPIQTPGSLPPGGQPLVPPGSIRSR
jgi:hypothetical protein